MQINSTWLKQRKPVSHSHRLPGQSPSRLWVSTLSSSSVHELRSLAAQKFPGTIALRIEGVIKQPNGHEITLPIDQDEELEAYLGIQGSKPFFSVQLVTPWKADGQM